MYIPSRNQTIAVDNPDATVKISQYEKIDVSDKSVYTGIKVANHFVDNIAAPAHFAKGAIQNKDGNRLESGLKEMYDSSSVLSYSEKGQSLNLEAGDLAIMSFYMKQ